MRLDNELCCQADEGGGFRTRAILCMPIKNASGKVIGVSQLVNKLDGTTFTKNDENLFEVSYFSFQPVLHDWCKQKAVVCVILSVGWCI